MSELMNVFLAGTLIGTADDWDEVDTGIVMVYNFTPCVEGLDISGDITLDNNKGLVYNEDRKFQASAIRFVETKDAAD